VVRRSTPPQSVRVPVDLIVARSVDEIKKLGTFRQVKAMFQEQLGSRVRVRARSWSALFEAIRHVASSFAPTPSGNGLFVDESARAIFALLQLHGDAQFHMLGITARHFGHRGLARAWRDRMARLVHPDRCAHPSAARAMAEVSEIYETMRETAP